MSNVWLNCDEAGKPRGIGYHDSEAQAREHLKYLKDTCEPVLYVPASEVERLREEVRQLRKYRDTVEAALV